MRSMRCSSASRSPCATASTVPSSRFFTYPLSPSRRAPRFTKSRYITICTRPYERAYSSSMCTRRDLNPHQDLRRVLFYPLNHGGLGSTRMVHRTVARDNGQSYLDGSAAGIGLLLSASKSALRLRTVCIVFSNAARSSEVAGMVLSPDDAFIVAMTELNSRTPYRTIPASPRAPATTTSLQYESAAKRSVSGSLRSA